MSGQGLIRLQRLLTDRYEALKAQIAHRLGGSTELAEDALHDAYVRLVSLDNVESIRHPRSYLVNTAVNSAIDRLRGDMRLVGDEEIESLFERARGEYPAPDRELMGRQRAQRVLEALGALPERQRALLVAYRVNGEDTETLATRWGISRGMIRREIRKANQACLAALRDLDGEGVEE